MRRTTTRVMNAGLGRQQAARLLGGCRSASIWRSDKPKDSIVSDLQDLNPQSTREKRFADEDTRPTGTLSQDTAAGIPHFACPSVEWFSPTLDLMDPGMAPRMDQREGDSSYGKDDIRTFCASALLDALAFFAHNAHVQGARRRR